MTFVFGSAAADRSAGLIILAILIAYFTIGWLMYWLWSRKEALRERRARATKGYREIKESVEMATYLRQIGRRPLDRW